MSGSASMSVAKGFLARHPALKRLLGTDSISHASPSQAGLLPASASRWAASRPVTRCFSNVALWRGATFRPSRITRDDLHGLAVCSNYGASACTSAFSPARFKSTAAPQDADPSEEPFHRHDQNRSATDKLKYAMQKAKESGLTVSNYWGIAPKTFTREDGSQWPWNSFRPRDTYSADTSIDLSRHHKTDTLVDKIAYYTVKILRWPTDLFFQKRYGCRAMMLETVAAVPGMVAGMLLHLKSLRRFEHSGGWIKALLEEAENERMHLMTFMEVAKPKWYERAIVFAVQGIFFNAYFVLYLVSPRLAHRITGYLEEEAIYSYTEYLKEIDKGHLPNIPAPAIAIDYWRLPKDAMIKDVVMVVRADEAHHRDVNHFAADLHSEGKELRDAPAPVGYH